MKLNLNYKLNWKMTNYNNIIKFYQYTQTLWYIYDQSSVLFSHMSQFFSECALQFAMQFAQVKIVITNWCT